MSTITVFVRFLFASTSLWLWFMLLIYFSKSLSQVTTLVTRLIFWPTFVFAAPRFICSRKRLKLLYGWHVIQVSDSIPSLLITSSSIIIIAPSIIIWTPAIIGLSVRTFTSSPILITVGRVTGPLITHASLAGVLFLSPIVHSIPRLVATLIVMIFVSLPYILFIVPRWNISSSVPAFRTILTMIGPGPLIVFDYFLTTRVLVGWWALLFRNLRMLVILVIVIVIAILFLLGFSAALNNLTGLFVPGTALMFFRIPLGPIAEIDGATSTPSPSPVIRPMQLVYLSRHFCIL